MVAEAIVGQLRAEGHDAEIFSFRDLESPPSQGDFLFVGSPIRMGKVTKKARKFMERMDVEAWKGKPIVTFVTMLPPPGPEADAKKRESYEKWDIKAAQQIREAARAMGLNALESVLMAHVKGLKGPLADDGLEKSRQFTHDFIATLNSPSVNPGVGVV